MRRPPLLGLVALFVRAPVVSAFQLPAAAAVQTHTLTSTHTHKLQPSACARQQRTLLYGAGDPSSRVTQLDLEEAIASREAVQSELNDVTMELKKVATEITHVQDQIEAVEQNLQACSSTQERRYLWKKEEQLRDEEEQLRDEEEQLRGKKEQLRKKEEQLRDEEEQLRDEEEQLRTKAGKEKEQLPCAFWNCKSLCRKPIERIDKFELTSADFKFVRESGRIYVDKTKWISKLCEGELFTLFLRPRGFGKSFFLSTIRCFFLDCTILFEGLDVYRETINIVPGVTWCPSEPSKHTFSACPVIYLDFSAIPTVHTRSELTEALVNMFQTIAAHEGLPCPQGHFQTALITLIRGMARHPQNKVRRVVILIDEYDAVLARHRHNPARFEVFREIFQGVLETLKSECGYILQCLVTGVTSYPKAGIFGGANNFYDLSLDKDYGSLCGFTDREVQAVLQQAQLRLQSSDLMHLCNGYKFGTVDSVEPVFNPFFVANVVNSGGVFESYWASTSSESAIAGVSRLQDLPIPPLRMEIAYLKQDANPTNRITAKGVAKFMFQTGYLTISGRNGDAVPAEVILDYPNIETRDAIKADVFHKFFQFVQPVQLHELENCLPVDKDLIKFFRVFNRYIVVPLSINLTKDKGYEELYKSHLVTILSFMPTIHSVATHSNLFGFLDIQLSIDRKLYVLELKNCEGNSKESLSNTAAIAIQQIEDWKYTNNSWTLQRVSQDEEWYKVGVACSIPDGQLALARVQKHGCAEFEDFNLLPMAFKQQN